MIEPCYRSICVQISSVAEKKAPFPILAAVPQIDRCFKLITAFSTTFVDHHMPEDTAALRSAFVLL